MSLIALVDRLSVCKSNLSDYRAFFFCLSYSDLVSYLAKLLRME